MPALDGLAIEAVEWLPSGSDAGLVRVRGGWSDPALRELRLPALGVRRGAEVRRFESLPDARFGRDAAVWRATYLVPAVLMEPAADELWLSWESGARSGLPAPARGFDPPPAELSPAAPEPEPEPGGEVIDRAVMAERRARRAEIAERGQAARTGEALKAVEVLELRSAELERRLEALQARETAERELAEERAAHAETRERLGEREQELAAIGEALAGVRAELARVRQDAAERAAGLERRLEELDTALAAERHAHAGATSELEAARAALAAAEVANRGEAVARAALDDELDRERVARATLTAALDAAQAEAAQARAEAEATQARVAELESHRAAAEREAGGLLARIAELERPADADLDRRAREQTAATAAAARPADGARGELSANLDAAAAALRARTPAPEDAPPAAAPVEPRPAAPRPRIVTESPHPARAGIVGSSKREYPWLRGALVKLAHDDPRTATRLMLALVPAQHAIVAAPLEYDLTIRGSGTYAVSIEEGEATARTVGGPRPRDQAAFHLAADVVTLAEMLAGVEKRMGRWVGSVKVHGRRRGALALRDALAGASLDLAAAARAGADLEPELVFRAFAYAIRPAWTKGHTFTVAQEISGPQPIRWHIAVRDGAPVAVERRAAQPPDAVVAMSRAAFAHLLRAEPAPSGDRPSIRGDHAAVATLKAWTDRAQGRAG